MAEILRPSNFDDINLLEKSNLDADAAAGQAVISPENADTYAADDFVVVGVLGKETSEVMRIASIAAGDITFTANLANKHYQGEPITKLFGNQIRLWRAANVDGTEPDVADFEVLGTVTIEADQQFTPYTDATGGADYWYKKTFYNSVSENETDLADAVSVRGGNQGHYVTTDEVKTEAGLQNNRWISDSLVFTAILDAESEVNASLAIGRYTLPLTEVPQYVVKATRLLAAGFLLSNEYGAQYKGVTKEGETKISQAREILADIEAGKKELVNSQGEAINQSSRIRFYPDDSAEDLDTPEKRYFSYTDTF